jgi:hypothetical protein
LRTVIFAQDKFVGIGGGIFVSTNGFDWVKTSAGVEQRLSDITYGNGTFVAVEAFGRILYSTNAIDWIISPFIGQEIFRSVAYANSMFVIWTDEPAFWYANSPDLWFAVRTLDLNGCSSVVGGNNQFVAVGLDGSLKGTLNGMVWNTLSYPYPATKIEFLNSHFLVLNQLWSRQCGVHYSHSVTAPYWWGVGSGSTNQLRAVAADQDDFYFVGDKGTIMKWPGAAHFATLEVEAVATRLHFKVKGFPHLSYVLESSSSLSNFLDTSTVFGLQDADTATFGFPTPAASTFFRLRER